MAAVPTPDAPACTSALRPERKPALHDEGVEGGDPHLGDGGGVGQRHRARHRHELALVHGDPLGVRPAADDAHHLSPAPDGVARSPTAITVPANSSPGSPAPAGGPG